jgi:hypothetical protein
MSYGPNDPISVKIPMTEEEFTQKFNEAFEDLEDLSVKDLGGGFYRLPGGTVTGKVGLEMFNQAIKDEAERFQDQITQEPGTKLQYVTVSHRLDQLTEQYGEECAKRIMDGLEKRPNSGLTVGSYKYKTNKRK